MSKSSKVVSDRKDVPKSPTNSPSHTVPRPPVRKLIAPPTRDSSYNFQVLHVIKQLSNSETSFLYPVRDHQLSSLCKLCTEIKLKEGQVLVQQGESATFVAIIILGRMRVDRLGQSSTCAICGDSIGESALMQSGRTTVEYCMDPRGRWEAEHTPKSTWNETVTALEDCVVAALTLVGFRRLITSLGLESEVHRHLAELSLAKAMDQVILKRDDFEKRRMEEVFQRQEEMLALKRSSMSPPSTPRKNTNSVRIDNIVQEDSGARRPHSRGDSNRTVVISEADLLTAKSMQPPEEQAKDWNHDFYKQCFQETMEDPLLQMCRPCQQTNVTKKPERRGY